MKRASVGYFGYRKDIIPNACCPGIMLQLFIFLLLIIASQHIRAQIKCKFEHYSSHEGLSHEIVTAIVKGDEGYLWIGTWGGLNRFDGHNFVSYKSSPGDLSFLGNDRIDQIIDDRKGYLWLLAYDRQVYRFDKRKELFRPVAGMFKEARGEKLNVIKIVSFSDGSVWMISPDHGLFYIPETTVIPGRYYRFARGLAAKCSLPTNSINFVKQDKQQRIWVGTPKGLACLVKLNDGRYVRAKIKNDPGNLNFTSYAESDDYVFLGTVEGYLFSYLKTTGNVRIKKITSSRINAICASKRHPLLYCSSSSGGLFTVNITDLSSSGVKVSPSSIFSLFEDSSGRLWVEPDKKGVILYEPEKRSYKLFASRTDLDDTYDNGHYSVVEDYTGRVWVAMKGEGFGYYDKASDRILDHYKGPDGTCHQFPNVVYGSFYDNSGIIWLKSDQRGLDKMILQGNAFQTKKVRKNSAFRIENDIRGLYTDKKGRLWVGTKGGNLAVYASGIKQTGLFLNSPVGGFGAAYCFLEDRKGVIWIGTKGNGLFRAVPVGQKADKYRVYHYKTINGDGSRSGGKEIYSIIEDRKGRIWIGSFDDGLHLAEERRGGVIFYPVRYALKRDGGNAFLKIRHINQDKNGILWVGTTDGLLLLKDLNGKGRSFVAAVYSKKPGDVNSLGSNDVQYIFRDSRQKMWLCTSGGGLNEIIDGYPMKNLKFRSYTVKDGLPSDFLVSCTEDKNKCLWIGSQAGLSRFNPRTGRFHNYNSDDGLSTGLSEASCTRYADGRLCFGTMRGYVEFDPARIFSIRTNSNLVLTNLQINGKDVVRADNNISSYININYHRRLILKYNENNFSLDYSVLDYRAENKQEYFYRLKGLDNDWQSNKAVGRATYTNLSPGEYVFEVKCRNSESYLKPPLKTLRITILPPWWRTWWAYSIYLICVASVFFVVRRTLLTMLHLRQRMAVERKLTDLKLNFFTKVSHELRTPLTLIINPIEEIAVKENLSERGKQYADLAVKNARRMERFMNQLLDLRKAQNGGSRLRVSEIELIDFIGRICNYFKEVSIEKNISIDIQTDIKELHVWLDAEKMDVVLYNILSNAFKFSPPNKSIVVKVAEYREKGVFKIEISDQGKGVSEDKINQIFELYFSSEDRDKHEKGIGIGLALSREFVIMHKGVISAFNNNSGGLTVAIELKMGKDHFEHEVLVEESGSVELLIEHTDLPESADISREVYSLSQENLPLVLLVDDNMELRSLLKNQLNEIYKVETASNGREGLEMALQLVPDLIISDVMMPEMDGLEMLDRLKKEAATSHIPVVLLSAKCSIESQIEGLRNGADFYITKPFRNDFLLASVKNLLRQRKKLFESLALGKRQLVLGPSAIEITEKDELFLKQVLAIVEEEMINPEFNIDMVAERVSMGRTTFYKKFKSLTDVAPVEFVRDMRLKRAMQYMNAGDANVSEIAYKCGFNNPKYFSTCFKEKYSVSPKEYLMTQQKELNT